MRPRREVGLTRTRTTRACIFNIMTLSYICVIISLFILEPLARNSVQDHNSEIDLPRSRSDEQSTLIASIPSASKDVVSTMKIKNTKRSKVHWCYWSPHMFTPMNILRDEFGYNEEVDIKAGDDWDLIFGGYTNCGDKKFDWKMETGLNKFLGEQGWDKLQPHQVWFPCMGCKESYCNKRDLCLLMKEIDPNYCFSLPDDRDRLLENMRVAEGQSLKPQLWVLKEDYPDKHLHMGSGVRFIQSEMELPNKQDQSSGAFLVQPLVNHKMGSDTWKRRHELKMYVCVTSTTPLRAYTYTVTGTFAQAQIDDANPVDPCSIDTHGILVRRELGCQINSTFSSYYSFDDFSKYVEITESEKQNFLTATNRLIGKVLLQAQPKIQNHTVNKGIATSGAACFSFLRVDFAMTEAIEPYIYEINEFPFANEKGHQGDVQRKAYRELFQMIGLDQVPIVASERSKYEMDHLGGWSPVVIDDVLINKKDLVTTY